MATYFQNSTHTAGAIEETPKQSHNSHTLIVHTASVNALVENQSYTVIPI